MTERRICAECHAHPATYDVTVTIRAVTCTRTVEFPCCKACWPRWASNQPGESPIGISGQSGESPMSRYVRAAKAEIQNGATPAVTRTAVQAIPCSPDADGRGMSAQEAVYCAELIANRWSHLAARAHFAAQEATWVVQVNNRSGQHLCTVRAMAALGLSSALATPHYSDFA